jgi:DoxX-like family
VTVRERLPPSAAAPCRNRNIAYWAATILLGTENVIGGLMAILRWRPYAEILRHLGYPEYFMSIIGVWYTLAGVALLAPRRPRLKEWAYAGLVFNYTGAAASHLAVGDGAGALVAPVVFTALAATSWALHPPSRTLTNHDAGMRS